MLTIQPIPAFNDNYIWLLYEQASRQAFVVDPGDATPVMQTLRQHNLELAGILITHHHLDHTGGLEKLCQAFSPVVYGPGNPAIKGITQNVAADDVVDVLGRQFRVIEVPGHTLDHIAYFHEAKQPLLFCGDTLFAGGCGRVFEGTPPMMHESLQELASLPADTNIYCAHEYTMANLAFARAVEPDNTALQQRVIEAQALRGKGRPTVPSMLSMELATNPFLRCDQPELREALQAQGKLQGDSANEVFATVRGWKDHF